MLEKNNSQEPWGPETKLEWRKRQEVKRSYADDVISRVDNIRSRLSPNVRVEEYGRLTVDPDRYPVYAIKVESAGTSKPNILITGGVHGYETSGVKGALGFVENHLENYSKDFNFIVAPCLSPWSYETINRLDPGMENPNREFLPNGKAEESRLLMAYLAGQDIEFDGHIDLHETTDSDKVFLPEEYAKNGKVLRAEEVDIPDGYYLIGVEGFVRTELERAIIEGVRAVTHIAEADKDNRILDCPVQHEGVVRISVPGLCAEYTAACKRLGAFTTEMYPDSPRFIHLSKEKIEDLCSDAQIASIRAALDYWLRR